MAIMFKNGTWIEAEEFAYPRGGQTRRGRALFPDGVIRACYGGIPDTSFTIPAHAKLRGRYTAGILTMNDSGVLCFKPTTKKN